MGYPRTDALLRAGLPAAAQRVAATNPRLRSAVAWAKALDAEAWKLAYGAGIGADDAEALAQTAVDNSCIEHMLEAREKRVRTLEVVLRHWQLTSDQQLTLAGFALNQATASLMLRTPWTTPEARALVARRAEGPVRLDWACRSSAGIVSDEDAVAHVAAALAGKDEISDIEAAASIGWLAQSRPGTIEHLEVIAHDTVVVGLSMANLVPDPGSVAPCDDAGVATLFDTGESRGTQAVAEARWERIMKALEGLYVSRRMIVVHNLLYRPEVPSAVKEELWCSLSADQRAEVRRNGVPDPRRGGVCGVAAAEVAGDLSAVEWLISVSDAAWYNSAAPLVWYELAGAPGLDAGVGETLAEHIASMSWRSNLSELRRECARRLESSGVVTKIHYDDSDELAEREKLAAEVAGLSEARRTGQPRSGYGWQRSQRGDASYNDPAQVPMEGEKPRWGYAEPFNGRADLAASHLVGRFGSNAAAWELLFGFVEEFDGTVGQLAESVELLASTATA